MSDYPQDKGYAPQGAPYGQPQYGQPQYQQQQPQYSPYPQPPAQGYYGAGGQAANYQGAPAAYNPPPQGYYPPQQQQPPQTVIIQQRPATNDDDLCLGCALGTCLCCCLDAL